MPIIFRNVPRTSPQKPVLMRMRSDQYHPLYRGDIAPVFNCADAAQIHGALFDLADHPELARERGQQMRRWLVRNHGRKRMLPILLALLHITARRVPLPGDLVSPLLDPLSEEEVRYHERCLQPSKIAPVCA